MNGPWEGGRSRLEVRHHEVDDQLFVKSTGHKRYPVLESVVAARPPGRWRSAALAAVYAVLPVTVVITVVLWFTAADRASAYLIMIGVVAVAAVLVFCYSAARPQAALLVGAHAVGEADADGDGTHLPLYELRSVGVTNSRRGLALRLVGPNQQRLTLPFGLLEANQQLWDLVYNGIRHSEATGAEVDARARQLLALPPSDGRG